MPLPASPLAGLALLSLLCLAPLSEAAARPVSAVIFPSGALVTEEESFLPEDGKIVLTLPAGADADSLTVSLSRGRETGRVLTLRKGEASPAAASLRNDADALRDEAALLRAELAGIGSMRQFWSQPPYLLDGASANALGGRMARSAEEARAQLALLAKREVSLLADLRQNERDISSIEARLGELGRQNADTRRCVLDVRDGGSAHLDARWTYWLAGTGWQPQYRVSADSAKGRVTVRMDAVLTQDSGMDWEGVDVTLSSAGDLRQVSPPALRGWVLGEPERLMVSHKNMVGRASAMDAASAVPSSQQAGSQHWQLGALDVPAGSRVSRLVAVHEFDATVRRLLRPSVSPRAWLEAALGSGARPVLPSGLALFSTDGSETARGNFSLSPHSRSIFLGIDQLVSAEVRELSGEAGKNSAQILRWDREVTVTNGHGKAVAVRVEEAAPVARDERIRVEVRTEPQAVFKDGRSRFCWDLDIPSRGSRTLRHTVRAEMPEKTVAPS